MKKIKEKLEALAAAVAFAEAGQFDEAKRLVLEAKRKKAEKRVTTRAIKRPRR